MHTHRRAAVALMLATVTSVGTSALLAPTARAADGPFPSREIRLIVPWNAGGSNDIAARQLQSLLAEDGVRVIVDNLPGGTGSIGLTKVASADPDGYTIGMGTSSTLALIAQRLTTLKNENFSTIARVSTDPLVLLVSAKGPAQSLDAFLAQVRANPNKISIGTPGNNNLNHIFSVMTGRAAGAETVNVPYPGGSKVVADLAGQQIDAAVLKPSESKGQIDAGLVKPIAVFADDRLNVLPDVPTFKEKGFNVFPYGPLVQMAYIVAPAGLPEPIRQRLITIFSKAILSPKFKAFGEQNGFIVDDLSGKALDREVDAIQKSLDEVGSKVFVSSK